MIEIEQAFLCKAEAEAALNILLRAILYPGRNVWWTHAGHRQQGSVIAFFGGRNHRVKVRNLRTHGERVLQASQLREVNDGGIYQRQLLQPLEGAP